MVKVALQLGKEACQKVGQPLGAPAQTHLGLGSGVLEEMLERPQDRPPRLVAYGVGVQTEAQLSSGVRSDERRPRLDPVEGHNG